MRIFVLVAVFLLTCRFVNGQFIDGRTIGFSIPDPSDDLLLASFARNRSIEREFGLGKERQTELEKLLTDSGGDLRVVTFYNLPMDLPDREARTLLALRLIENQRRLNEIISPQELDRLRQLAYQVEIARVGLSNALVSGFLGLHSGVEQYQKPALTIRGEQIEAKAEIASKKVVAAAWLELFQELSPLQRGCVERLVGKEFDFIDEPDIITVGWKGRAIPDPCLKAAVVLLTRNKSIAKEIRLDHNTSSALSKFFKDVQTSESEAVRDLSRNQAGKFTKEQFDKVVVSIRGKNESQLEEILDPVQLSRLKEIAFRVEAKRIGLKAALMTGYLGEHIGIEESQKAALAQRAEAIETKSIEAIKLIVANTRSELFRELTPSQRDKAERLLGKVFLFSEVSVSER